MMRAALTCPSCRTRHGNSHVLPAVIAVALIGLVAFAALRPGSVDSQSSGTEAAHPVSGISDKIVPVQPLGAIPDDRARFSKMASKANIEHACFERIPRGFSESVLDSVAMGSGKYHVTVYLRASKKEGFWGNVDCIVDESGNVLSMELTEIFK